MYLTILSYSPDERKEQTIGPVHRMPLSLGTPRFMWPCSDHLEFFSFFPIFWAWDVPGLRARTFQAWWVAAVDKLRAHKCQLRAQRRFLRKCLKEEDGRMVSLDLTAPWDTLTNHLLKAQVSLKYSRLKWKTCPQERTSHPSPCWRLCCLFKAFWCKTI